MPAGNSPNPGNEGQTPGDGQNTPFGDGMGETQVAGAAPGAHDFVQDPNSHAPAAGGRDFTKESRSQQMGTPEMRTNQDDAASSMLPFADTDAVAAARPENLVGQVAATPKHKAFKV
jgi:hypothetical protein